MLLREISEPNRSVSFALGRLNPATVGHGLLVEAVKQGPGDAVLFLTDRPAKLPTDPLNPNEKLDWARKSFPDIKIELAKNIMFAASDLYGRGYRSVTFFEGEDKLGSLLEKYNGQKSAHGFFEFEEIKFERLSRNPDAEDASGMSASKLRKAVQDNDFDAFSKGVTKSAQPYAKKMFDNLSTILGEDVNELNIFKSKEVDNADPKLQDPNKLKVLDWIAARTDGKEHFLSFYKPGAAYSGNLLFVDPINAKKFMRKVDDNPDYIDEIKKALTSVQTAYTLFKNLGLKAEIRKAR